MIRADQCTHGKWSWQECTDCIREFPSLDPKPTKSETTMAKKIIAVVSAPLEAQIADLKAALEKYGRHMRGCKCEDMLPCDCGFMRATQYIRAEREEAK